MLDLVRVVRDCLGLNEYAATACGSIVWRTRRYSASGPYHPKR